MLLIVLDEDVLVVEVFGVLPFYSVCESRDGISNLPPLIFCVGIIFVKWDISLNDWMFLVPRVILHTG